MNKWMKWSLLGLFVLLIGFTILVFRANQYTPIDEWSTQLTKDKIEWAEAAYGYGEEKISYDIPQEEYELLIGVLNTISEDCSTRNAPKGTERTENRLAMHYDGKLWLFNCKTNGLVGLTFDDAETGAIYGCEGKVLYIDSSELYNYIVNTVCNKAS